MKNESFSWLSLSAKFSRKRAVSTKGFLKKAHVRNSLGGRRCFGTEVSIAL